MGTFKVLSQLLPRRADKPPISLVPLETEQIPDVPSVYPMQRLVDTAFPAFPPPEAPSSEVSATGNDGSVLHDYVKNTDYWFNMELSQLEKYAISSAVSEANAGLPRQDAPAHQELAMESILRGRSAELFLAWASRVRRKVQDGIQTSSVRVGESLVQLRHTLNQLELTSRNIKEASSGLRQCREAFAGELNTFEYSRLLPRWLYISALVGLVVVDWVTNVPIFGELLPKDPNSEQRWADIVDAAAAKYQATAGFHTLWDRILFAPDASVLALGVIIFLMLLGHISGMSLRRLIAFQPDKEPAAGLGLRSLRRQAWLPFSASTFGIVMVVLFLFLSRGQIKGVTEARLADSTKQVAVLSQALENARIKQDETVIQNAQNQLDEANTTLNGRRKSAEYATSISGMNVPILLLNIVLVITSAATAYMADEGRITETRSTDPRIAAYEARLVALQSDALSQRQTLKGLSSDIQANIAKAKYLAQSQPLSDWPAKVSRLEAVIPLFRTENARQRGIDVDNILAFQVHRPLELPPVSDAEKFHLPGELGVFEAEFSRLRSDIEATSALTDKDFDEVGA